MADRKPLTVVLGTCWLCEPEGKVPVVVTAEDADLDDAIGFCAGCVLAMAHELATRAVTK